MGPLSETDVQRAILKCFEELAAFRRRFLDSIALPAGWQAANLRFESARQSVHTPNGETDVEVKWRSDDGRRLATLCEVKLEAQFMPKQGERYRGRATDVVRIGEADAAITVLIAHSSYLRGANPEARLFDRTVRLDDLPVWARGNGNSATQDSIAVLDEAAKRLAAGKPLGAKGLHPDLYRALADECVRRQNGLEISNRTTDWVYLKHPSKFCKGVNINYRVDDAVPEIRIWHYFKGNREKIAEACQAPLTPVYGGKHLYLRLPPLKVSDAAKRGIVTESEVTAIMDACEWLLDWWARNVIPNS